MSAVRCPRCRNSVDLSPRVRGQAVRCPSCNGEFLAPGASEPPAGEPEAIPTYLLVLMAVPGHVLAILLIGMIFGLATSTTLVLLVAVIEIVIWQRKRFAQLSNLFEPEPGLGGQSAGPGPVAIKPTRRDPTPSAPSRADGLVEIQTAAPPVRHRERIPTAPYSGQTSVRQTLSGTGLKGNLQSIFPRAARP